MKLQFTRSLDLNDRRAAARRACEDPASGIALSLVEVASVEGKVSLHERVVDAETRKPIKGEELAAILKPYLREDPADAYNWLPAVKPVHIAPSPPKLELVDALGLPLL